jgi:uncharacterized protein (DUF488 family)
MLYSIGYQKITVDQLISELQRRSIGWLVDVRSKPYSRKHEFNQKQLREALEFYNIAYVWKGDTLGGFSLIAEADIAELAKWQEDKIACLMCMEADPLKCHRDQEIAIRLMAYGVTVEHILT